MTFTGETCYHLIGYNFVPQIACRVVKYMTIYLFFFKNTKLPFNNFSSSKFETKVTQLKQFNLQQQSTTKQPLTKILIKKKNTLTKITTHTNFICLTRTKPEHIINKKKIMT